MWRAAREIGALEHERRRDVEELRVRPVPLRVDEPAECTLGAHCLERKGPCDVLELLEAQLQRALAVLVAELCGQTGDSMTGGGAA